MKRIFVFIIYALTLCGSYAQSGYKYVTDRGDSVFMRLKAKASLYCFFPADLVGRRSR